MGVITDYLIKMDKWERGAFFPYLFAPILLTLLMIFLLILGAYFPLFVLIPIVLSGYYTFFQISRRKFAEDGTQFLVSGGMIMFTLFFPLLVSEDIFTIAEFTVIYILLIIPIFLGHVYSIIFQITANLSQERKALMIQE